MGQILPVFVQLISYMIFFFVFLNKPENNKKIYCETQKW